MPAVRQLIDSAWFLLPVLLLHTCPEQIEAQGHRYPCGEKCFCLDSGVVTCRRSDLTSIPTTFDIRRTNHLVMIDQPFIDKTLRRQNISYMSQLEKLDIKSCGIEALEPGVFTGLRFLRSVDLSNNNIRVVQDFTFRGVQLKYLFLNNNKQLRLQRRAFSGLQVESLSMDNCGLRELNFETFLAINGSLHSLWLVKNEIVDFDPRFKLLFGHLKTFNVRENPFRCKCRLRWLVEYLQRKPKDGDLSGGLMPTMEKQPVCSYPQSLAGIELRSLTMDQLTCDPPRLGDIEVSMLSEDSGRLRCAASGYPLPVIEWRRKGSERAIRVVRPVGPSVSRLALSPVHAAEVAVDRRSIMETYECLAHNAGGNVTLTVRLRWPSRASSSRPTAVKPVAPQVNRRPTAPSSNTGQREGDKNSWRTRTDVIPGLDDEESNPFFQKKFTLLELIGAVVGTFTATLALFLVICRCITYAKKKQKKQQWSTYESAYSGSHVYDVPRHDQGSYMAAKTTMGTADRHEFLDYKTGRKVYDHV